MKRAILIVLDGCGAGEAPDSPQFGDLDHPATVRHVFEQFPFEAPHLRDCGFLAACGIESQAPHGPACYGRLRELSQGKDSVTGHWELMGIHTEAPFPTYPHGFPAELIQAFEARIGRATLGNKPASGTAILDELGPEHLKTGAPIIYTSADSVFQIAAHEDVVPLDQLYDWCLIARELCQSPNNLQRVIARPFIGSPGSFTRTGGRRDFPLEPPRNLIDVIAETYGQDHVLGVGVVPELFNHRGFKPGKRTTQNAEHEVALLAAMDADAALIFANFEDFDMLYGHRNDPEGFSKALVAFDATLAKVQAKLKPDDLLILSADHGNDPTSASTDHSREYVPVVLFPSLSLKPLGDVDFMGSVAKTIASHLEVEGPSDLGTNLLS